MPKTINDFVKKTIFWQRTAMVVLFAFMAVVWFGYFIFIEKEFLRNRTLLYLIKNRMSEVLVLAFLTIQMLLGVYVVWLIYQSSTHLKGYLIDPSQKNLELSFRYQRYTWRLVVLMICSVFLFAGLFSVVMTFNRF